MGLMLRHRRDDCFWNFHLTAELNSTNPCLSIARACFTAPRSISMQPWDTSLVTREFPINLLQQLLKKYYLQSMDFILIRGVLTVPAISVMPAEHELGLGSYYCTNKFTSVKCTSAIGRREAHFWTHLTSLDKVILYETRIQAGGDLSVTFLGLLFYLLTFNQHSSRMGTENQVIQAGLSESVRPFINEVHLRYRKCTDQK